jgi:membrane protein YdbS with pleckstrin-like domain
MAGKTCGRNERTFSGILFRQYETIAFSRIQTLDLERGPLLWLFGLTEMRL